MGGGGGFFFFETAQERNDWAALLRRHSGHHFLQNVFATTKESIGTGAYSRVLGNLILVCPRACIYGMF